MGEEDTMRAGNRQPLAAGPLLVATDAEEQTVGALRVAHALAARDGRPVRIVSAFDIFVPFGIGLAEREPVAPDPRLERGQTNALRDRVVAQLRAHGFAEEGWPVSIEIGPPAPTIVRAAREAGASMIILGLGRHAPADRLFGSETAVRVAHLAPIPVLAVHRDARDLPRTAVVAIDFSSYSADALRLAAHVLGEGGELHLLHVLRLPGEIGADRFDAYRSAAKRALDRTEQEISHREGVRVFTHLVEGNPAREILRIAEQLEADLVAAGSHGHGFIGRMLLGSVSTKLLRGAQSSVLIAPPAEPVDDRALRGAGKAESAGEGANT